MSEWTNERVESLKSLWQEGLSASQIAARMGGVTRNGVIGKVHRLGLSGRVNPAIARAYRQPRVRRTVATRTTISLARTDTVKAERAAPPPPEPIPEFKPRPGEQRTILTITEHTCKWPIGDPQDDDFHFCGRAKHPDGKPYCAHHTRIAYVPTDRRTGKPFVQEPRGKKTFRERAAAQ